MKDFDILHSKLILIPVFLASIVASVYLLQIVINFLSQFSWLFIIFVYAYIVYALIGPLDGLIQKAKLKPEISLFLSFIVVFALITLAVIFINPLLIKELGALSDKIRSIDFNATFGSFVNNIANMLKIDTNQLSSTIFNNIKDFGLNLTNNFINIFSNALSTFVQLVLALIFGYFFIRDGHKWFKGFLKFFPKHYRDEVSTITDYFNKSAKTFLRIQVFMAFIYGIINYVVMSVLGIDFSLSASIVAFITFIIPGIGPLLSMIVPVAVTLLFDASKVIYLIIILLIVQQLILNILIPKIYGDKVGVHPIVILLSIIIGIQLFGVLGAFIVIPLVAVIANVINTYYFKDLEN